MASPTPQPLALAKLKGADKHDPQRIRKRANEPKPRIGIGSCPDWLSDKVHAIWVEIECEMAQGVLTMQDRQPFQLLCSLIAEFRFAPTEMAAGKLSTLNSLFQQFGMTPSSRTKVATVEIEKEAKPENTFAEFVTVN